MTILPLPLRHRNIVAVVFIIIISGSIQVVHATASDDGDFPSSSSSSSEQMVDGEITVCGTGSISSPTIEKMRNTSTTSATTKTKSRPSSFVLTTEDDSDDNDDDTSDIITIPQPDPTIIGYPISRYSPDRRTIDNVDTVRIEHKNGINNNPLGVASEEWKARTELAAAYRALYIMGLERSSLGSDQSAQCLMHRLEEDETIITKKNTAGGNHTDQQTHNNNNNNNNNSNQTTTSITFLMADWGVWFEEVTASNLMKFTVDGHIVYPDGRVEVGDPIRMNTGCIPVAKAIYETRNDVKTIIHIHPYSVMAVGGLKWGLLPLSQAAFFLWGQVSREDYDFTYQQSFEATLAQGFVHGERAMLLNHHGMYAVGRDVAEAVFVATHLTQACEVQVRTLSMVGGDLRKVFIATGEELSTQYKAMMDSTDYSYDGSREWPGIVRKVQRQAPDFNT